MDVSKLRPSRNVTDLRVVGDPRLPMLNRAQTEVDSRENELLTAQESLQRIQDDGGLGGWFLGPLARRRVQMAEQAKLEAQVRMQNMLPPQQPLPIFPPVGTPFGNLRQSVDIMPAMLERNKRK